MINKELWEEAERQAKSAAGGFAGLDEESRKRLTQDRYDQLEKSDEQVKKFEGEK